VFDATLERTIQPGMLLLSRITVSRDLMAWRHIGSAPQVYMLALLLSMTHLLQHINKSSAIDTNENNKRNTRLSRILRNDNTTSSHSL